MVQEERHLVNKETEKVLDFFKQAAFSIESDHDLLKDNQVETTMSTLLRRMIRNPQEGMLSLYLDLNQVVKNQIIKTTIDVFIKGNKNVKGAKVDVGASNFNYYLQLKDDSDNGREAFYDLSYSFLNSDLCDKFNLCFYFADARLFKEVKAEKVK